MALADEPCVQTPKGTPPMPLETAERFLKQIHPDWRLENSGTILKRVIRFKNFKAPMNSAVLVGDIAERENHHPDLLIAWGRLEVIITTHSIKGLAESDFIFAAKVDAALAAREA